MHWHIELILHFHPALTRTIVYLLGVKRQWDKFDLPKVIHYATQLRLEPMTYDHRSTV